MINLTELAPHFTFIVDKGFISGTATYDPQSFGDASLVMIGVPFSLLFVRDRGQVLVEVGNDVTGWYLLEYVLEFLDGPVKEMQVGESPTPALLASLLQDRWDKVVDLFGNKQRLLQLHGFIKQKSTNLLDKIFSNP